MYSGRPRDADRCDRSEEHTSELQSQSNLVCRLLLEKKNTATKGDSVARALGPAGRGRGGGPPAGGSRGEHLGELAVLPGVPFFFNDTATTETYTLSLHDALPISV